MELPKEEATRLFDYANKLYVEERYAEALSVLDELMSYRKNSRRVLFARADCLYRMERVDEAMHICDELIAYHDYEAAKKLRVKLENKQLANLYNGDPAPNSFALPDLDFDLPPTKIGLPPVFNEMTDEEKNEQFKQWLHIGLPLLCIPVFAGGISALLNTRGVIEGISLPVLFFYTCAQLLSYLICLGATFFLFKKFEKETPLENAAFIFKASMMLSVLYTLVAISYVVVSPVIAEVAGLFILNIILIVKLRFSFLNLITFFMLLFILRITCAMAFISAQIMALMG